MCDTTSLTIAGLPALRSPKLEYESIAIIGLMLKSLTVSWVNLAISISVLASGWLLISVSAKKNVPSLLFTIFNPAI